MAGSAAIGVGSGTSDSGCGADRGARLDADGDTCRGAAASAGGAPDHAPTTLTAVAPPAEDGAGASAADAPDHDMTTVTDAAPTEDVVASPQRPGKYSVVDEEYIRRRRQRLNAKRQARRRHR